MTTTFPRRTRGFRHVHEGSAPRSSTTTPGARRRSRADLRQRAHDDHGLPGQQSRRADPRHEEQTSDQGLEARCGEAGWPRDMPARHARDRQSVSDAGTSGAPTHVAQACHFRSRRVGRQFDVAVVGSAIASAIAVERSRASATGGSGRRSLRRRHEDPRGARSRRSRVSSDIHRVASIHANRRVRGLRSGARLRTRRSYGRVGTQGDVEPEQPRAFIART